MPRSHGRIRREQSFPAPAGVRRYFIGLARTSHLRRIRPIDAVYSFPMLAALSPCIGLGDSFALSVTATRYFAKGQVGLKDVKASPEGGGGFYASRVCQVLAWS